VPGQTDQNLSGDPDFQAAFRAFRKQIQLKARTHPDRVRFALDELEEDFAESQRGSSGNVVSLETGLTHPANDEDMPLMECHAGFFAIFALAFLHQNSGARSPLVIAAFRKAKLDIGKDFACATRLRRLGDNEGGDKLIDRPAGKRNPPLKITDEGRSALHTLLAANHPELPEAELVAFLPRLETVYPGVTMLSQELRTKKS